MTLIGDLITTSKTNDRGTTVVSKDKAPYI